MPLLPTLNRCYKLKNIISGIQFNGKKLKHCGYTNKIKSIKSIYKIVLMYLFKIDVSVYNFQRPSSKSSFHFEDGFWKL